MNITPFRRAGLSAASLLCGAAALTIGLPGIASAHQAPTTTQTIYTLSNAATGNTVLAFHQQNGTLVAAGSYATGGSGTGAGLGSQGAVVTADQGRILLAVNAGSNSLTSFRIGQGGALREVSTVASGGQTPISVTSNGDEVYVLNAGNNTIAGFRLDDGWLSPIAGSVRSLSAGAAGAAEIAFSPDGRSLVVTEKGSNTIDTFAVSHRDAATAVATASVGSTPFGFDFDRQGDAIVSDAAGGNAGAAALTSYSVHGSATAETAYVPDGQTAACWVIVDRGDAIAYTTNAGSGTVSSYSVQGGQLVLINAVAQTVGGHPTDESFGGNGNVLYIRDATGNRIQAVTVLGNGALGSVIDSAAVLPASASGLASIQN